ncbi:MAG: hypothetical protein ACRD5G_07120 [Candidatus Acidiferrales bacterium]
MNVTCKDLERILERQDPRELAALQAHAAACDACGEQLALDREISAAAHSMQRAWESPELWPRIRERLIAEPRPAELRWKLWLTFAGFRWNWQMATAAAVLALVAITSAWIMLRNQPGPQVVSVEEPTATTPPAGAPETVTTPPAPEGDAGSTTPPVESAQQRLLTEEALGEVERAEAAYVRSIDRLSKMAAPQLQPAGTPLMANYREKLLLLDSAIAECRAQLEQNRFNGHLRRELLAIYQMKQSTLTAVLQEEAR